MQTCLLHNNYILSKFINTFPYLLIKSVRACFTPPLWRDLVKISTSKPGHSSSLFLECTDFKNVIFEKIPLPVSEVAEVAEVKRPRKQKRRKFCNEKS